MPSHTRRRPLVRQTLQFFASRGLAGGLRTIAGRLSSRLRRTATPPAAGPSVLDPYPHHTPPAIHPFDVTHCVDTSGFTRGEDLAASGSPALWATAYYGIAPSVFQETLSTLARTAGTTPDQFPWPRFTFIDLGSGKGRALLLASSRPFHHILGVELDTNLSTTAQANLASFHAPWQRCHSLEARTADATTLSWPLTPLVVFLYHPFLAPVLRRVLQSLDRSLRQHPRELWLLYLNPEAARVLRHFPRLELVHHSTLTLAPEDQLADRFSSTSEDLSIYRYTP